MKNVKMLGSLVLSLITVACAPNDFESTSNPTTFEEISKAETGLQVNIRNRIPQIPSVEGRSPTVVHINGQVCNWEDMNSTSGQTPESTPPNRSLSECFTFSGTIHSGETETFLIPVADLDRISQVSGGRIKFRFKSSTQGTSYFQGCVGSLVLSPEYQHRKVIYNVDVDQQNVAWGYQCGIY